MAESYVPRPFYQPRYVADTGRLSSIYDRTGAQLAALSLRRGATTAETLARLGSILSATSGGYREDQQRKDATALRGKEQEADRAYDAEQKRLAREERAAERTTDREVRSAERGDQQFERTLEREIETGRRTAMDQFLKQYGGIVGPNGQAVMPPTPAREPNPTEASMALDAAKGNKTAADALRLMRPPAKPESDNQPLVPIVGPDGKTRYGTRAEARGQVVPAGAEKPSSGVQKRVLNFFNRAQQADTDLESIEAEIQKMNPLEQGQLQYAPNFLQSQLGQSYQRAQRAFTEARLRKDSGAAIPKEEFENDRKTYFAQFGDTAETLEDKRRARAAMLASLGFESGQALSEFVGDADEAKRIVQGYKDRSAKATTGKAASGMIEAVDEQGGIHHAPAGTPLPAGWKLKQ